MKKQTASFSAHVSRSAMGRYLRDSLPADQAQQIETHFQHCPQCSGNLTEYIQNEEPDNQKAYHKKIKGKLKQESSIKKKLLSPFQVKMFRSGAAVIALLIFSFFAIKTVMNKKVTDSAAPSGAVAITQPAKPAPIPKKATTIKSEAPAESEQPTATEVSPTALPQKKPASAKPKATSKKQAPKAEPVSETPTVVPVLEKSTPPSPEKEQKTEEAPKPVEQKPIEKIAPLPTLEKLDATQNSIPAPPANPL